MYGFKFYQILEALDLSGPINHILKRLVIG